MSVHLDSINPVAITMSGLITGEENVSNYMSIYFYLTVI